MRGKLVGAAVGTAAAAAVLTACGGGGSGAGSGGSGSAAPAAAGATSAGVSSAGVSSAGGSAAPAGTPVTVDASEFTLALPSKHLAPGTYTFTMANVGHATHAIEIEGPGVDHAKSGTAGPGGSATLTVTLQPGSYELWCPVGNHKQAGMDTTITVG